MTWVDVHFGSLLVIALGVCAVVSGLISDLRWPRMSAKWFRSQPRDSEIWE